MTLDFCFPQTAHPSSDSGLAVFELAEILEGKYGIIESFTQNEPSLISDLSRAVAEALIEGSTNFHRAEELVKTKWRKYGRDGRFGEDNYVQHTESASYKRAEKKARRHNKELDESDARPFIDTHTYQLSMQPKIEMSSSEIREIKRALKDFSD